MKSKNKTTENQNSVESYITTIADDKKRKDCSAIIDLISKQTDFEPKMWGTAIVEFGSSHYTYESGREDDRPLAGFSSRASSIVLYLSCEVEKKEELMSKFGKHKMSDGCIHIQKLEDIDTSVLTKMVKHSIAYYKKKYPS